MDGKNSNGKLLFILIAVVLAIMTLAVVGENGLIDLYRFKREKDGLLSQKKSFEEENKRLTEEIRLLKSDNRYIAAIARNELGMVAKNEVIYRVEPHVSPASPIPGDGTAAKNSSGRAPDRIK